MDDNVSAKENKSELRPSRSGLEIWLMVRTLKIAVATVVNSSKLEEVLIVLLA